VGTGGGRGAGAGAEGETGEECVIGNFNNWKKVCPATADVWASVLRRVRGCGLWLMRMLPYDGPEAALRRQLQARGVEAGRVAVTDMLPAATHLLDKARQVAAPVPRRYAGQV
jgi:predicted O-linked N-acetylglucosamine transferase (SPINDLY family)